MKEQIQTLLYGSNVARLVRVKAQYDADGVFRFAQGVPPR
ncbi:MAG: Berberine and berberine like [Burkholderiales bacterium]